MMRRKHNFILISALLCWAESCVCSQGGSAFEVGQDLTAVRAAFFQGLHKHSTADGSHSLAAHHMSMTGCTRVWLDCFKISCWGQRSRNACCTITFGCQRLCCSCKILQSFHLTIVSEFTSQTMVRDEPYDAWTSSQIKLIVVQ